MLAKRYQNLFRGVIRRLLSRSIVLPLVLAGLLATMCGGADAAASATQAAASNVRPALACVHPFTIAAFQVLVSMTALVAFDD